MFKDFEDWRMMAIDSLLEATMPCFHGIICSRGNPLVTRSRTFQSWTAKRGAALRFKEVQPLLVKFSRCLLDIAWAILVEVLLWRGAILVVGYCDWAILTGLFWRGYFGRGLFWRGCFDGAILTGLFWRVTKSNRYATRCISPVSEAMYAWQRVIATEISAALWAREAREGLWLFWN